MRKLKIYVSAGDVVDVIENQKEVHCYELNNNGDYKFYKDDFGDDNLVYVIPKSSVFMIEILE